MITSAEARAPRATRAGDLRTVPWPFNVSNFTLENGRRAYDGFALTLPMACSQTGRASANHSASSVLDATVTLRAGRVETTLQQAMQYFCSACSCADGSDGTNVLRRRFRSTAASQLEVAFGPEAKLAFELDAASGTLAAGASRRPLVGIFVLHGRAPSLASRLFAHSFAQTLWPDHRLGSDARLAGSARLHVNLGPRFNFDRFDFDTWRQWLGDAAPLLGGIHLCGERHRLSPYKSSLHQGNYMHKAWTMVAVARMEGYAYVLSTDDDVILPPHTIRGFISATLSPSPHVPSPYVAKRCGTLLPALSNGIPVAEHFASVALPTRSRRQLESCYAGTDLAAMRHFGPIDTLQLHPIEPWDGGRFYDAVRRTVRSVYKGIHPVRANNTCMTLSLHLALEHLSDWWTDSKEPGRHETIKTFGPVERHDPTGAPYSYFTNTIWMASADVYAAALLRVDLAVDSAEEVTMNRFIINEQRLPLCILTHGPALHPAYNSHRMKPIMVEAAVTAVESLAGLRSPAPLPNRWRQMVASRNAPTITEEASPAWVTSTSSGDAASGSSAPTAEVIDIAVCITGRLRTFGDARFNIKRTQIAPLQKRAEVFAVIDLTISDQKLGCWPGMDRARCPVAIPSERTAVAVNESAAMALLEPFAPRSVDFARSASQNDGLHRCLQAISTREDIRMETFEWVLRLRPDVVYGRQLPFAGAWPRPGHAAVAFVDSPRTQICCDGQKGRCQASAVCVNDVWALLTRAAASVYMARRWPKRCWASNIWKASPPECDLGCALQSGNVSIGVANVQSANLRDWDVASLRGPSIPQRGREWKDLSWPTDALRDVLGPYPIAQPLVAKLGRWEPCPCAEEKSSLFSSPYCG